MSPFIYRPGPPLDAFVDFFWFSDGYIAPTPRERVLPSGALTLVVNLEADRLRFFADEEGASTLDTPGAVLCGAQTRPLLVATSRRTSTLGVHFKAGGARPFLRCPAGELEAAPVPLDLLWGATARGLRERLLAAPTHTARFRVLKALLLERARGALPRDRLLRVALAAFEEPELGSVAEVNRRTGLSPKRLLALFRDDVGLAPKAFWRVRRFRAALLVSSGDWPARARGSTSPRGASFRTTSRCAGKNIQYGGGGGEVLSAHEPCRHHSAPRRGHPSGGVKTTRPPFRRFVRRAARGGRGPRGLRSLPGRGRAHPHHRGADTLVR